MPIIVDTPADTPTTQGVCSPWAQQTDITEDTTGIDGDTLDANLLVASEVLFNLTGRQWAGSCTDTVRPCARSIAMDHGRPIRSGWYSSWAGAGYGGGFSPGAGSWFPSWGFCSCNRTDQWGCQSVPAITLGVYPLTAILEVKIDGVAVDLSQFAIHDNRWLVRLGDPANNNAQRGFPCCSRQDLPDTEEGTFSVMFRYGAPPPAAGVRAAAQLGYQYALACTPSLTGRCRLPQRTTSFTRLGETVVVMDPMEFIRRRETGLVEIDSWISAINPAHLSRRSTVLSPDLKRRVSRVTG